MSSKRIRDSHEDIAIVGMSCRFPGADNIERYWQNLRDGVTSISFFTEDELKAAGIAQSLFENPNYVKAGAVLDDEDLFDAQFFGFTDRESELMDPQQRVFMECAWEALEEGGYDPETYPGRIGVYAGQSQNTYILNTYSHTTITDSADLFQILIGNEKDHLPTRVSYKLNLKGPSINVQTACSTSLVAIVLACQALLDYRCDMALAGGVSIRVPSKRGYLFQEGGILSPDGLCCAFDARAQGTVGGDGAGVVLLKRLEDALADGDNINAIIKGTAINNDGSAKVGYTAPGVDGQTEVIVEALAVAKVEAETIAYVEAHGTGTALGDPIEIGALTRAFRHHSQKKGFCAVGSVKTNIGHLDAAAGVAGLIKTVLSLKHRMLPPSLHFEKPNPRIDFANSPFYVNTKLSEWHANGTPRRAGVSSFGIGGTNAHIILEEATPIDVDAHSRSTHVLVLSARTPSALETAAANLAAHLRKQPDLNLADVTYTLQVGRRAFRHRRAHVCTEHRDALASLERPGQPECVTELHEQGSPSVVMMFPGQGAQHINMARGIYESEPVFRKHVDLCAELLEDLLGLDLRGVLFPSPANVPWAAAQLNQTSITQPALFVVEYALAKLWIHWGVRPAAMIGHSVGEYVAACVADTFSLEDGLRVVTERARLMQNLPTGAMLAVYLSEDEVTELVKHHPRLSIAAHNGPTAYVVSGAFSAVERFEQELMTKGIHCKRLRTSHAFHSEMMEPMMETFGAHLERVSLRAPRHPYISNVTGKWITATEATSPDYWIKHLRRPVCFTEGVAELLKETPHIMLEVGPGQTLGSLLRHSSGGLKHHLVLHSLPQPESPFNGVAPDVTTLLKSLARLWTAGVKIDWTAFHQPQHRRRVSLPTYPFERRRYWLEPRQSAGDQRPQDLPSPEKISSTMTGNDVAPANQIEEMIAAIWQEVLGLDHVSIYDNFFELGGNSLIGLQLMSRLRKLFVMDIPIAVLFETPTIAGLGANICDRQRRANDLSKIERMLQDIEQLSDVEVRSILEQDSAQTGH